LVSDGFSSYVIFLYADGLIQWTFGDASRGVHAEVGFNAGNGVDFASHPDSRTGAIINIANSSIPEGRTERGMLVYRVDGREITQTGCGDTSDGEDYNIQRISSPLSCP
jgi:hypothetical protein